METGSERDQILRSLRQFLEEQYPKLNGSGWMVRDIQRRHIQEFLRDFEVAAAKAGEGEK